MYNYNRVRSMDNLNNTNYKSREEKRKYKEELAISFCVCEFGLANSSLYFLFSSLDL